MLFELVGSTAMQVVRPLTAVVVVCVWPLGIGAGPIWAHVEAIVCGLAGLLRTALFDGQDARGGIERLSRFHAAKQVDLRVAGGLVSLFVDVSAKHGGKVGIFAVVFFLIGFGCALSCDAGLVSGTGCLAFGVLLLLRPGGLNAREK